MEPRVTVLAEHIKSVIAAKFATGADKYFLSQLGHDLGPLREELEELTGRKLRAYLHDELSIRLRRVEGNDSPLVILPEGEPTAPEQANEFEPPPPSENEVGVVDILLDRGAPSFPRYRGSVWSAFVIPLKDGLARYLDVRTLSFADQAEADPAPQNACLVPHDLVCPQDAINKPEFVHSSVLAWAASAGVDPSALQSQLRSSQARSKQDPVYPSTSSTIMEPIFEDAARYGTKTEALNLIDRIRSIFTCKKLEAGEDRSDHEYLWVFNYALTEEQERRREKGNYARIFVEKVGTRWHVRAHPLRDQGWKSPVPLPGWQYKDHPNWGLRTLKLLKRGPLFFSTEAEARAEMDWLVDSFTKVIRLSDNKIACMVYKRGEDGKSVDFDKVQIRLAYDHDDRPFLYMDWRFAEKHKPLPMITYDQEHSAEVIDALVKSMFGAKDDIQIKVAKLASREILNWEGRGKLKAISKTAHNLLYHYTSLPAMDAILASGRMWLTDLRYMNDWSEMIHGYGVLTSFFSTFSMALGEVNGQPSRRRTDFIAELDRILATEPPAEPIYGLCLSDDVGIAAQWMTYGNRGSGVALGFDRDLLAGSLARSGLGLRRVHYHPDRKANIIHNILKSILEEPDLDAVPVAELAPVVAGALRSIVPTFKHESFYTEKEWRLIRRDDGNTTDWTEEQRPKGEGGVGLSAPYVTLDLSRHLGIGIEDILRSIIVGPGPLKEERKRSVEGTLRRHKLRGVMVAESDVPLSAF